MEEDNFTFDIETIVNFLFINYKQLLLICLVFIIIYIVDLITFHNSIIYGITSNLPRSSNFRIKNKK
jgi:hypothetical protein